MLMESVSLHTILIDSNCLAQLYDKKHITNFNLGEIVQ